MRFRPADELALELIEGLHDPQDVLEMPDIVGLPGGLLRDERPFFDLVGERVQRLARAGDDAVAVDAQAARILHETEFHREPVEAREPLLEPGIPAGQRGLADFLAKVGEARMHDHRRVAKDVMEAVRRRRVVELEALADIVGAWKNPPGEVTEKIVRIEQARGAGDLPACGAGPSIWPPA